MLNNRIRDVGEQLASCPLGQIVFRFADKVLWTLETSVQWFMRDEERNGPPIRPLPWIFFLPLLLWLRLLKGGLALITFVRGKETLPPIKVVSYIQIYRRRLRGVKYTGLKNFTNWRMAQEEKKKADGEFSVLKVLGIYWLSAFTGIGRVLSPIKVTQEKQLKPMADESCKSSEAEYALKNLNQIYEEPNGEDDPEYDPLTDQSDDSEDTSGSFDSSDDSLEESLETAEAGSESTSHTFYSSSNITPEPNLPQASHSTEQVLVEKIPCQTLPGIEQTQEQSNHVEKQREESPSSQNENVSEQEKLRENLSHPFKAAGSIEPVTDQSAPVKISNINQISSSLVEEKQNVLDDKPNQLNNVQEVNSDLQEKEKSKIISIFNDIVNFPQNKMQTAQLPSADNHLENIVQKDLEVPTRKISSDVVKEQSFSTDSKEKCDDNQYSEGRNQYKELDEKHFQSNLKNDLTEELKQLAASLEIITSLANDTTPFANASNDFINSEISASLPPLKDDSAIEHASTLTVKEDSTEDKKPKRRFSDFFIMKKKT